MEAVTVSVGNFEKSVGETVKNKGVSFVTSITQFFLNKKKAYIIEFSCLGEGGLSFCSGGGGYFVGPVISITGTRSLPLNLIGLSLIDRSGRLGLFCSS